MITMLYIMVIGILVTTGATYAVIANTQGSTIFETGALARQAAESGIENALLRYIRNPSYSGETMTLSTGQSVTTTIIIDSGVTVTSSGNVGGTIRQIEATIQYNDGILEVLSWKELP